MAVISEIAYDQLRDGPLVDIMRGTTPSYILSKFGLVFAESRGTDGTYSASLGVETLHIFLSHCWKTNRWLKFFALCYTWNVQTASLITGSLVGIIFLGIVCLRTSEIIGPMNYFISRGIFLDGAITWFLLLLCFAQYFHSKDCHVFLDKVCIHQTDEKLKQRGIGQLGKIVANCKTFLVLYDDWYFSRLWCTYELAVYVKLHKQDPDIVVVPVHFPLFVLACIMLNFLGYHICFDILWKTDDTGHSFYMEMIDMLGIARGTGLCWTIGYSPAMLPLVIVMQLKIRQDKSMRLRLANFVVSGLECSNEDDQELILGRIEALWGNQDVESSTCASAAAQLFQPRSMRGVQTFENFVRHEFPKLMTSLSQDTICDWKIAVLLFMPGMFGACVDTTTVAEDVIISSVGANDYLLYVWINSCFYSTQILMFYPLMLVYMMRLTKALDGIPGGAVLVYMISLASMFFGQSLLTWLSAQGPVSCLAGPALFGLPCAFEYRLLGFSASRAASRALWTRSQ